MKAIRNSVIRAFKRFRVFVPSLFGRVDDLHPAMTADDAASMLDLAREIAASRAFDAPVLLDTFDGHRTRFYLVFSSWSNLLTYHAERMNLARDEDRMIAVRRDRERMR